MRKCEKGEAVARGARYPSQSLCSAFCVRFKATLPREASCACCFALLAEKPMAGMESIYSLIPQPVPPVIKPDRYHSKHPGNKPPT